MMVMIAAAAAADEEECDVTVMLNEREDDRLITEYSCSVCRQLNGPSACSQSVI